MKPFAYGCGRWFAWSVSVCLMLVSSCVGEDRGSVSRDDGHGGQAGAIADDGGDAGQSGLPPGGGETGSGGDEGEPGGAGESGAMPGAAGQGGDAPPVGGSGGASPPTPPPGLVPMFVAAGQGGRTITSCDDGKTWVANHSYENRNEDHSEFTHKGLAYGQGHFVVIMAWGADVSLKVSDDGVNWTRKTGLGRGFYGGIAHGGGAFAMIRQGVTQWSRDQGKTWTRAAVQPRGDHREAGGGGDDEVGVFAGGGSGQPTYMSWDAGRTWKEASGCPGLQFGGIGQHGGMAYGNGSLVLVGDDGRTCQIRDGGAQVQTGRLPDSRIDGKLFFTGGAFWVGNGDHGFTSADGGSWTRVAFSPATTRIHAIARGDSGTYVGIDRDGGRFFRSEDGKTWTAAAGSAGTQLFRVVFGHGKPSATCPAP